VIKKNKAKWHSTTVEKFIEEKTNLSEEAAVSWHL